MISALIWGVVLATSAVALLAHLDDENPLPAIFYSTGVVIALVMLVLSK